MPLTRVHVNRAMIAANRKDGGQRPVYTIKSGGKTTYAHAVMFRGPVRLIDPRMSKPLSCGATVWLETFGEVVLVEPCSYEEAIGGRDAERKDIQTDS